MRGIRQGTQPAITIGSVTLGQGRLQSRIDAVESTGWTLIPADEVGEIHALLGAMGRTLPAGPEGSRYRDLQPYSRDRAPQNSMSAITGTDAQPMHTDRAHTPHPPRYVALQCIDPGEGRCPTKVWALNGPGLARERPPMLSSPQWVFHNRAGTQFYSPIMEVLNCRVRIRFDPLSIYPASFSRDSVASAEACLRSFAKEDEATWERGALLLLDNWRCLHARSSGGGRAPSRRLRRWYIGDRDGLGERAALQQV